MSETRQRAASVRHAFVVDDWKPITRNTLRGFCSVTLPSGMILSEVAVHVAGEKSWAMPASKPMVSREGTAMREQGGKIRYATIVSFASKDLRDRFSRAVLEALLATHAEALG